MAKPVKDKERLWGVCIEGDSEPFVIFSEQPLANWFAANCKVISYPMHVKLSSGMMDLTAQLAEANKRADDALALLAEAGESNQRYSDDLEAMTAERDQLAAQVAALVEELVDDAPHGYPVVIRTQYTSSISAAAQRFLAAQKVAEQAEKCHEPTQ